MLSIHEGQYTFPMYIEEEGDDIYIYVGNAKRKKSPCIRILIYKKRDVILEDLVYLPHCSISEKHIQKGNGSVVIMLQSVLKWLIKKYIFVQNVEFSDESYVKTKNGNILLAEKGVLTEGQTWYMKHFGAEPCTATSEAMFQAYKRVYEKHKNDIMTLDEDIWLHSNQHVLYSTFPSINGKRISGTTWKIRKDTIMNYNVNPVELQIGAGIQTGKNLKKLYLDNKKYVLPDKVFVLGL
jgi:hypothetical protein